MRNIPRSDRRELNGPMNYGAYALFIKNCVSLGATVGQKTFYLSADLASRVGQAAKALINRKTPLSKSAMYR